MAFTSQAITHPAVTRAQVQNAKLVLCQGGDTGQNVLLDVAEGARTECPLGSMNAGKVAIGKREIVAGGRTSAAFRGANGFIVFDEARIASHGLGQKCSPDALLASQPGPADQTIKRRGILILQVADGAETPWASQPDARALYPMVLPDLCLRAHQHRPSTRSK